VRVPLTRRERGRVTPVRLYALMPRSQVWCTFFHHPQTSECADLTPLPLP
jgi:hypothetical protein